MNGTCRAAAESGENDGISVSRVGGGSPEGINGNVSFTGVNFKNLSIHHVFKHTSYDIHMYKSVKVKPINLCITSMH